MVVGWNAEAGRRGVKRNGGEAESTAATPGELLDAILSALLEGEGAPAAALSVEPAHEISDGATAEQPSVEDSDRPALLPDEIAEQAPESADPKIYAETATEFVVVEEARAQQNEVALPPPSTPRR
jgi:hypothetical protein